MVRTAGHFDFESFAYRFPISDVPVLMRAVWTLTALAATMLLAAGTPLSGEKRVGVLLMHAKGGSSSAHSPIGRLARSLESNGFLVSSPDMPWSRTRGFDKAFEESMTEIDERVEELKERGATHIVVGGHSIGANAALGYGARRHGLAGILAIAPGHYPELGTFQDKAGNDWKVARKMVEGGRGEAMAAFKDATQRRTEERTMTAKIYLSWFDPEGPAVMPANTANLKAGAALLWIIGQNDPQYRMGKNYAFSSAPSHPKNAYIVVKGGHNVTPQTGENEILRWLRGL